MKTKATSFRFDEDDLILAKNKSGIKKTQKLMDFLLSEYVREFKPTFIPLPMDYIAANRISAIKSDGTVIKDITDAPKPAEMSYNQAWDMIDASTSSMQLADAWRRIKKQEWPGWQMKQLEGLKKVQQTKIDF